MKLPKTIFLFICLSAALSAFASEGLREAGEAFLGGAQVTVLRNGTPISTGSAFETYGKLYLAPEPASFALLICLLLLNRRNR
jgi:hypothetical protein